MESPKPENSALAEHLRVSIPLRDGTEFKSFGNSSVINLKLRGSTAPGLESSRQIGASCFSAAWAVAISIISREQTTANILQADFSIRFFFININYATSYRLEASFGFVLR